MICKKRRTESEERNINENMNVCVITGKTNFNKNENTYGGKS